MSRSLSKASVAKPKARMANKRACQLGIQEALGDAIFDRAFNIALLKQFCVAYDARSRAGKKLALYSLRLLERGGVSRIASSLGSLCRIQEIVVIEIRVRLR